MRQRLYCRKYLNKVNLFTQSAIEHFKYDLFLKISKFLNKTKNLSKLFISAESTLYTCFTIQTLTFMISKLIETFNKIWVLSILIGSKILINSHLKLH